MPLLTRIFIKTAIICLALALVLGILLASGVTNGLFPVYIHLLVFGWLTQLPRHVDGCRTATAHARFRRGCRASPRSGSAPPRMQPPRRHRLRFGGPMTDSV